MSIEQLARILKPWKRLVGQPLRYFVYDMWKPQDFTIAYPGSRHIGAAFLEDWQWFITQNGEMNIRPSYEMMSKKNAPPGSQTSGFLYQIYENTASEHSSGLYGHLFEITDEIHEVLDRDLLSRRVKTRLSVNMVNGQRINNAEPGQIQAMTYFDCINTIEGNMNVQDYRQFQAIQTRWYQDGLVARKLGFPLGYIKLVMEVISGLRLPAEPITVLHKVLYHVGTPKPLGQMLTERITYSSISSQALSRGLEQLHLFQGIARRRESHNEHHTLPPGTKGQRSQMERLGLDSSSSSDESDIALTTKRSPRQTKQNGSIAQRSTKLDTQQLNSLQQDNIGGDPARYDSAKSHTNMKLSQDSSRLQRTQIDNGSYSLPSPPILPSHSQIVPVSRNLASAFLPSQRNLLTNARSSSSVSTSPARSNTPVVVSQRLDSVRSPQLIMERRHKRALPANQPDAYRNINTVDPSSPTPKRRKYELISSGRSKLLTPQKGEARLDSSDRQIMKSDTTLSDARSTKGIYAGHSVTPTQSHWPYSSKPPVSNAKPASFIWNQSGPTVHPVSKSQQSFQEYSATPGMHTATTVPSVSIPAHVQQEEKIRESGVVLHRNMKNLDQPYEVSETSSLRK